MKVSETPLPGVLVLEPKLHRDDRGFFLETYRQETLQQFGIKLHFVQDNHSQSTLGVLRGLHYQLSNPQGKLVRVVRGSVYDVTVDVRQGSPTFGQWYGTTLDDQKMRMLYIPPGFAHGFLVLSDITDFVYKCTDYYHPQSEHGILWNDPAIGIKWPLTDVLINDKDLSNPLLQNQPEELLPIYTGLSS